MIFPDGLPFSLEYRMGNFANGTPVVRTTLPRRPVSYMGSGGSTDSPTICPRIPFGATAWRRAGETEWRDLKTIPKEWLVFLNRERRSELDPRP